MSSRKALCNKKVTQNKDFRTLWHVGTGLKISSAMQKAKSVSELISGTSKVLLQLRERLDERARLLLQVRATLPPALVPFALSAGLKDGVLTIGTGSAAWASRLRYVTPQTMAVLNADYQLKIVKVKIRVVRGSS